MSTNMRTGIYLAGNMLVDIVKNVDCYPAIGMLANISQVSRAVGGCVPNTAIDLAKIDPSLPLAAIGRIGQDAEGDYIVQQLNRYHIDTSRVQRHDSAPTSFSDVISLPSGERTFFHARGANAEFSPADVDMDSLDCAMLHAGYVMLLDTFDQPDDEYGTVMAHFLHDIQARGIRTSIDAVSDSSADYGRTLIPALRYCHYVIINEIECCGIWGLSPRNADGSLAVSVVREAMDRIAASGVQSKVIVHSKEAGFCLDIPSGHFTAIPSLAIAPEEIAGSVGAGDAFCAGCLYALYHNYSDEELLAFASAAAACNLSSENSVDGMKDYETIRQMAQTHPRLSITLQ